MTGEKKHHLELSAGPSFNWPDNKNGDSDDAIGIPIAANIGWRIQKPNKSFIFKMGLAMPEGVYFGLGFSF